MGKKHKLEPKGPFGSWLFDLIKANDVSVILMGLDLHMNNRTIYHDIRGDVLPSFRSVVTYCWYFNYYFGYNLDPNEIFEEYVSCP